MVKEETKEAAAETKTEGAAGEAPEAEAKVEVKLEEHYPEPDLKNGEVILKRKSGKPRWRKIESKNNHGKLYSFDWEWKRRSAKTKQGHVFHDLRWHLRNKWVKVEKFEAPKRPAPKPKAAEEAPAAQ